MKNFKIRCSAIGQIMADPRTKKDKEAGNLSATAKTYLRNWYIEDQFSRKKEFTNKFLEKGIAVEDEAIALYSKISGKEFLKKNEKELANDYCTGTPDVITDIVVDVKSSWDIFTFPLFDEELKNKDYWWQLQGYMWLTDKKEAELAYCLVDTPEALIIKQINTEKWNAVGTLSPEEETALEEAVYQNMTFDDIPEKLRVKTFAVHRDDEAIEQIKQRVEKSREFLAEIHNKLLTS